MARNSRPQSGFLQCREGGRRFAPRTSGQQSIVPIPSSEKSSDQDRMRNPAVEDMRPADTTAHRLRTAINFSGIIPPLMMFWRLLSGTSIHIHDGNQRVLVVLVPQQTAHIRHEGSASPLERNRKLRRRDIRVDVINLARRAAGHSRDNRHITVRRRVAHDPGVYRRDLPDKAEIIFRLEFSALNRPPSRPQSPTARPPWRSGAAPAPC